MFMDIRRIELGLIDHSCTKALAWCNENKAALRKLKVCHLWRVFFFRIGLQIVQSTLEFDLRLQEYIELARLRQTDEAIGYLKRHIINWHDAHIQQIKQASALLAFPPDTTCNPYKARKIQGIP